MKCIVVGLLMTILISGVMFYPGYSEEEKEPKRLIPKFSWQGEKNINKRLLELREQLGIPHFWSRRFAIKGNYLYTTDYWNNRIQVFKINPDGSLSFKFSFGKGGEGSGEFNEPSFFTIREDYLYV